MAIIKIRTGGRGRPTTIDTEYYRETIYNLYEKASPRLEQIRKSSTGYRGEEILGSEQSYPDWVTKSLDVISDYEMGGVLKPSKQDLADVKATIKSLQQLSSPRVGVSARALSQRINEYYLGELGRWERDASSFTKKRIGKIKERLQDLSPKQITQLMLSKAYQDPKTAEQRYERVKKWSESKTKRKLTYQEAWIYLLSDKLEKGIN